MSGKRAKARRRTQDSRLRGFLLGFIQELRRILKRRWPELRAQFPDQRSPCHTCALNPGTDNWRGFDSTAIALMRAIEYDEPFYCHEPFERTRDGWKFDREKPIRLTPARPLSADANLAHRLAQSALWRLYGHGRVAPEELDAAVAS